MWSKEWGFIIQVLINADLAENSMNNQLCAYNGGVSSARGKEPNRQSESLSTMKFKIHDPYMYVDYWLPLWLF